MGNETSTASSQGPVAGRRLTAAAPVDRSKLSLATKNLGFIPPELSGELSFIESLDLRNNYIKEMPNYMPVLKSLDLSFNQLDEKSQNVIFAISQYPALEDINLSYNNFNNIPIRIAAMSKLKTLNMSANNISELPDIFGRIETLIISQNNFKELPNIPPSITTLNMSFNFFNCFNKNYPNLTVLKLELCGIESIDPSISMIGLKELDISKNRLKTLPDFKKAFPNLQRLDAADNMLTEFPNLPLSIQEVSLIRNEIDDIHPTIYQYPKLTILYLSSNKIKHVPRLPETIQKFLIARNGLETIEPSNTPYLTDADFSYNHLTMIPQLKGNRLSELRIRSNKISVITMDNIQSVVRADFSYNDLTSVSPSLFQSNIRRIDLSHNSITQLPPIQDSQIMSINISFNPLANLPEEFPKSLTDFYCGDCRLLSLPPSIGKCPRLDRLVAPNNMITVCPKLEKVKTLNLSCNNLVSFPELPSSIRVLDLSCNNIAKISDDVSLPNLVSLDISLNRLSTFPILHSDRLQRLNLFNNKITCAFDPLVYPKLEMINTVGTNIRFDEIPDINLIYASKFKVKSSHCIAQTAIPWIGVAEAKGFEKTMENFVIAKNKIKNEASCFAVFDGHLGTSAATYCAMRLPQEFQNETNFATADFLKRAVTDMATTIKRHRFHDVATCAIAVLDGNKFACSNVGDARCMIITADGDIRFASKVYSPKMREEFERVHASSLSVGDQIQSFRAIGHSLEKLGVTCVSEETEFEIADDDKWLVVACNGLFEVLSDEEIALISKSAPNARQLAYRLRNAATASITPFNVSVIAVDLELRKAPQRDRIMTYSAPGASNKPRMTRPRREVAEGDDFLLNLI